MGSKALKAAQPDGPAASSSKAQLCRTSSDNLNSHINMAITAPLNAIFTPAPKCLQDNFYDTSAENPDFIGTSGNDTVVIRGIQPQCYPISFASIAQAAIQEVTETDDYGKTQTATSTANLGSSTHGRVLELSKVQSPEWMPYYSPGPCPLGYGTAAHTVMTEGVTAATCCPV